MDLAILPAILRLTVEPLDVFASTVVGAGVGVGVGAVVGFGAAAGRGSCVSVMWNCRGYRCWGLGLVALGLWVGVAVGIGVGVAVGIGVGVAVGIGVGVAVGIGVGVAVVAAGVEVMSVVDCRYIPDCS